MTTSKKVVQHLYEDCTKSKWGLYVYYLTLYISVWCRCVAWSRWASAVLAPAPGLAQVSERSWIMSPVVPLDNDVLAQICIPSLCTAEESYREGGNDVPDSRHANLQTSLPVVNSYTVGVSRRHENIARIPLPFLLCAHRISHATSPVQVCSPSLDSTDTLMVTHSSSSSSTDMLKALLDRSDDGGGCSSSRNYRDHGSNRRRSRKRHCSNTAVRNSVAFFLLGLINNSSYVIMMAFAKDIMPAAVGWVYLVNVLPALVVKLSAPYWFHLVPYSVRVSVSSLIMMLCFISVAYGRATWVQLFGVTCAALQEGVGEASFLALASLYDTPRALSAWSSGTGFAGIFGYGWVYFLTFVFGLSNRSTLVVACSLAVAWMFTFFVLLTAPRDPTAGPSGDGGGNGCDTGRDINNEYSMIDDDDGDAHEGASASSLHGSVRRHVRVPRGGRAHHNLRRVVGCGDNNTTSNSTTTGATAILTLSSQSYPSSSRARFVDGVKGYAPLPSRQSSPRPPPHVSPPPGGRETGTSGIEGGNNSVRGAAASVGRFDGRTLSPRSLENASVGAAVAGSGLGEAEKAWEDVATLEDDGNVSTSLPVAVAKGGGDDKRMTPGERLRFTLGLWRYMLPLSLVFFAEYTMQTGAWSAIGFPITSEGARKRFYEYSNWSYQGGAFVGRSSGLVLKISAPALWILPAVQMSMLMFFIEDASGHFWYDYGLLFASFGVGVVGGLAYVNAFRLIAENVVPERRELALASASAGDSLGVTFADVTGTLVQKYLYRVNNISD